MARSKQGSPTRSWKAVAREMRPEGQTLKNCVSASVMSHSATAPQRRLASALGIPSSTLHDNLEKLGLRAHSNALKPYLTDEGKRERVVWVLRWVRTTAAAGGYRVLHDFEDFVHVDEKWFYLFQDGQKFYLLRRRATPCPQGTEQAIHHEGHVYRCCCSPASQPSHELRLRR